MTETLANKVIAMAGAAACSTLAAKSGNFRTVTLGVAAALLLSACTYASAEDNALRVRITAGASAMVAQLEDTPTARSFAALLPLQLPLRDHASTEKVATLPQKLSVEGAPPGADADIYDIAYYEPLGNFVLYYQDPGYFLGLVRLGRIQTGAETLQSASGTITIEGLTP